VTAEKEGILQAECSVDGKEATASQRDWEITKGKNRVAVICTYDGTGKEVSLKLKGPFSSRAFLPIDVRQLTAEEQRREDEGLTVKQKVNSQLSIEGPYAVTLTTEEMPFTKEGDYLLYVGLSRAEKGVIMKELDLVISETSPRFGLRCDDPFETLRLSATEEDIKKRTAKDGSFAYRCYIDVEEVEEIKVASDVISEATYTIEKEFKTKIA